MKTINPIKKLIVNNVTINHKTDYNALYLTDKAAWYAYTLYINNAYPAYLIAEINSRYGKQDIIIEISKHNKYKSEQLSNPEWFKI
jgi:hypothetical protein